MLAAAALPLASAFDPFTRSVPVVPWRPRSVQLPCRLTLELGYHAYVTETIVSGIPTQTSAAGDMTAQQAAAMFRN